MIFQFNKSKDNLYFDIKMISSFFIPQNINIFRVLIDLNDFILSIFLLDGLIVWKWVKVVLIVWKPLTTKAVLFIVWQSYPNMFLIHLLDYWGLIDLSHVTQWLLVTPQVTSSVYLSTFLVNRYLEEQYLSFNLLDKSTIPVYSNLNLCYLILIVE